MAIIWCTVPEILSLKDRSFCHFGLFLSFYPLWTQKIKILKKIKKAPGDIIILQICTINDNHIFVCFLRYGSRCAQSFVILDNFLLFYIPNNPQNQNFEKMKKASGDIIILHKCNINNNHTMCGSWDMKCDRQNVLSFWTIFCPFTP